MRVVVIYPGFKGDADGYNGKYLKIAKLLIERNIGAVVRMNNFPIPNVDYQQSVKDRLREVLSSILSNDKPTLYLMGISAGAGAIAAIAYEYPQVEKILLIAPSGDAGLEDIKYGLGKYAGELYITVGANDEIVGAGVGELFFSFATKTKIKKAVVVPECDHQFRGEINGKILSKAPLWAFNNDETYPSPEGGIKLYD